MATPPSYGDLGKKARDLFSKGYDFGLFKLETKSKTDSNLEFTVSGSARSPSKVDGSLETKYKCSEHGVTFTEKWSTNNVLSLEMSLEDKLLKGSKVGVKANVSTSQDTKSAKLTTGYKQEHVNVAADVDLIFGGPVLSASAVLGYQDFLLGYQMSYDSGKSALTKNNFALGYSSGDLTVHANVDNAARFGASLHHRISKKLEMGVALSTAIGTSETRFALGSKYSLDSSTSFQGKVNNSSEVGMSLQHKIRDGIKVTLSSLVDGSKLGQDGCHQLGLSLDLEA